jgi:5-methylthioadenosine/S-adenosylhomocysteine deaminase
LSERTMIKATWIVAYDGHQHRLLKDGVVVYEGNNIVYVGRSFDGCVKKVIDATGKVVTPGFISTHAHIAYNPLGKSFLEDRGVPQFYYSPLYEDLSFQVLAQDDEADRACVEYSVVELLRTGVTCVIELQCSLCDRPTIDIAAEEVQRIGSRIYLAPQYNSARWYSPDGNSVQFKWREDDGRSGLEEACNIVKKWDGAANGRIRGMLAPAHSVDCSEGLLRETRRMAKELNVPITIHASEAVIEFQEILRRHGKTPIAWLRDIDFLGPEVILAHAIHIGGTSWTNYPEGDLDILASTGASVSHSPWSFFRRGVMMESFGKYLRAGVTMSLGTDLTPQSMLNSMRFASCIGKAIARDNLAVTASDAFNAATLGGAKALGRDDLGRIAQGAKADFVIWDINTLTMAPLRDPIRNIVYSAEPHDVEAVIVDGNVVMENRQVLRAKVDAVLAKALQTSGEKMWPSVKKSDLLGRDVDQLSPLSFPLWNGC